MALNSVQIHVKELLNGLVIPDQSYPMQCFIAPPQSGDAGVVTSFVWGATINEARRTMPRFGGYKKLIYALQIWIYQVITPGFPDEDVKFPLVIDAVMAALRADIMPVFIIDPITQVKSQLLAIGEKMTSQYAPVTAMEQQDAVLYQGLVIAQIEEDIQGTTPQRVYEQ